MIAHRFSDTGNWLKRHSLLEMTSRRPWVPAEVFLEFTDVFLSRKKTCFQTKILTFFSRKIGRQKIQSVGNEYLMCKSKVSSFCSWMLDPLDKKMKHVILTLCEKSL